MNIRLLLKVWKVYGKGTWRILSIFIVMMLLVYFIASPSAISYAHRVIMFKDSIEDLSYHIGITIEGSMPKSTLNKILLNISHMDEISSAVYVYIIPSTFLVGSVSNESTYVLMLGVPSNLTLYLNDFCREVTEYSQAYENVIYFSRYYLNFLYEGEVSINQSSEVYLKIDDNPHYTKVKIGGYYSFSSPGEGFSTIPIYGNYPAYYVSDPQALIPPSLYEVEGGDYAAIKFYIKVVDTIINPYDIDQTVKTTTQLMNKIINMMVENYKIEKSMIYASNNLYSILMESSVYQTFTNFITGFFAIPYFFGIWYLISINIELLIGEYREELGILMIRGLSKKYVTRAFISFIILISLIALSIGILTSPYVSSSIAFQMGYGWIPTDALYSVDTLIASLVLGIIVVSSALFYKRELLRKINILDASRKYTELGEEIEWRPTIGFWIVFGLGILKILEWLLGINIMQLFSNYQGGLIVILVILYSMLSSMLTIFGPIFFIYGVTMLLIHSKSIIMNVSKALSKIIIPSYSKIISNYISRTPRHMSKSSFLASLIIALLIYYLIFTSRVVAFSTDINNLSSPPSHIVSIELPIRMSGFTMRSYSLHSLVEDINISLREIGYEGKWVFIFKEFPGIEYSIKYSGYTFDDVELGIVSSLKDYLDINKVSEHVIISENTGTESEGIGITYEVVKEFKDRYGINIEVGKDLVVVNKISGLSSQVHISYIIVKEIYGLYPNSLIVDYKYASEHNLVGNFTIGSKLYLLFENDLDFKAFSETLNEKYKNLRIESYEVGKTGFLEFINILAIVQESLKPYDIFGSIAALVAIIILSLVHVRSMMRDLVLFRMRGLGKISIRFIYATILPIILIGVLIGVVTGFISGYGASQQYIMSFIGESIYYPIIYDIPSLIGIILIIVIFLLSPIPIIMYFNRYKTIEAMRHV